MKRLIRRTIFFSICMAVLLAVSAHAFGQQERDRSTKKAQAAAEQSAKAARVFNEIMGTHLSKDEADTLAGYLYDQMGRVPQGGESIMVEGLTFTIEQVTGRHIRRVRVLRGSPPEVKPDHEKFD